MEKPQLKLPKRVGGIRPQPNDDIDLVQSMRQPQRPIAQPAKPPEKAKQLPTRATDEETIEEEFMLFWFFHRR